jgi:hypothetical protein
MIGDTILHYNILEKLGKSCLPIGRPACWQAGAGWEYSLFESEL